MHSAHVVFGILVKPVVRIGSTVQQAVQVPHVRPGTRVICWVVISQG
jgi:hypothetical protein